jgi:hypothetical protein
MKRTIPQQILNSVRNIKLQFLEGGHESAKKADPIEQ